MQSTSPHQHCTKSQLNGFLAISYRQRHLLNEFHIMSIEVKTNGVIMHAKSVNCRHMAVMCCSFGSCTCRTYTCKPVEMHLNCIPLFPFGSNHTLSDRNIGYPHHDSHGNPHTFANIAANGCICYIPFCICTSHCSTVWMHRVQHSVLLLCPVDQVQENEEELYARLTLVCARCRLTLICFT